MKEVNWDKYLCRCSSLGALFTEPKLKKDKEAGELSATAKTSLVKYYIQEYWGRKEDISTKQMQKGILCEPELIKMLGELDGKEYIKNEERKNNEWITGVTDLDYDDYVEDGKSSWSAGTFLSNLLGGINKDYYCQLQGYMWLWNKPKARLSYGLISAPESLINKERYYLLSNMDVTTEESPEFRLAEAELRMNMTFEDIPKEERIIRFEIERDEEIIKQIPEKVTKARAFLKEFHKIHTGK